MSESKKTYGWKKELPSNEHKYFGVANYTARRRFPKKMELDTNIVAYDQGQLGSCTANALAFAFEYEQLKQKLKDFMPSRLFIYYNERKIESTISVDSGATISDGILSLKKYGTCSEDTWPYDVQKFAIEPTNSAYKLAIGHQIMASRKVPETVRGFKTMINMGCPVVFGFTVYESFESQETANTGIMKMPKAGEKVLGGHAVVCVGYDNGMKSPDGKTKGYLKIRNSWGPNWGQNGYFWMPYDYVRELKLVSDLWSITQDEEETVALNNKLSKPENIVQKAYGHLTDFICKR